MTTRQSASQSTLANGVLAHSVDETGLRKVVDPGYVIRPYVFLVAWQLALVAAGDTYTQPDGTAIELERVRSDGDSWLQDARGFSVVEVPARYEYALASAEGGLDPSGVVVGSVDPRKSALTPRIVPDVEFLRQRRAESPAGFAPPSPLPIEVKAPTGATLSLKLRGSGAYLWYEDEFGYSVVQRPVRYEYALRGPSGALIPCGILVGSMNPSDAGLKPGISPTNPRG